MQNKYSTLPFLILLLLPAISLAQSGCELHISPDFASDCVLTSYHNEDDTLHSDDLGDFSTPACAIPLPQSDEFVIEHKVQNECGCKASESINVKVVEPASLQLSCYGTHMQSTAERTV